MIDQTPQRVPPVSLVDVNGIPHAGAPLVLREYVVVANLMFVPEKKQYSLNRVMKKHKPRALPSILDFSSQDEKSR